MSSILGGRSGNRGGRCAQPCRMAYSIIDYNKGTGPFSKWDRKYILSPKDLNTLDDIHHIIDSGINSLKIEGRMKRSEYVATVVKYYRKALDLGKIALPKKIKRIYFKYLIEDLLKGQCLKILGKVSYPMNDLIIEVY